MPNINKAKRLSWEWKPTQKSWSNTAELYQDRQWVKLSKQVRQEEPFCKECLKKGITTLTEVADHIISVKNGGKFFDRSNLQGLCRPCNNAKKI
jgi:5-methylcytosine-specific restriction protein A